MIDDIAASGNVGAMLVKIVDNMDNLHPKQVASLMHKGPKKAKRLAKRYRASISKLYAAANISENKVLALIGASK